MKLPLTIATLSVWASLVLAALADGSAEPRPWIVASSQGGYFFKMVPPKWRNEGLNNVIKRQPFGVAYEVTGEGQFKELWRVSGWYTFEGYLSDDGRYFVQIGPRASDRKGHTDLAIAFYDRGKLLESYRVKDLIKKPELLEYSVSQYQWRPDTQSQPTGFQFDAFHLVMIDKTAYDFDYQTGKIVTSGLDPGATSGNEIRAAERAESGTKGRELFAASSFKKSYEERFVLSEIEAPNSKIMGVHFTGPEWRATLTSKRAQSCSATAVFPIRDDKTIEVSVEASEIDDALTGALAHPFVAKMFAEEGATGLRMRLTGDRLHWDTPELAKWVTKVTGAEPKTAALRDWAYLIIDSPPHRYTSIYFHTQTKELIYEDETKQPREPVLLNAVGQRR